VILGWTPLLRSAVRKRARTSLAQFQAQEG
jgi:hypothetical protein